ncbi:hypothetical protein LOD99_8929 [Oopsacas minuta]|uniref:Uncharacterized protein n=1 Tax=Oopsacas minuta TaxID=111878 RepID=A0AAV7JE66_9METZ|nr:hypothetical protein LOD99_8929 [Oopsacas minuta]
MTNNYSNIPTADKLFASRDNQDSFSISNQVRKIKKETMIKGKRFIKDGEKRLPADMMADDEKIQARIHKQFEKQRVSFISHILSPNYLSTIYGLGTENDCQ